jgi:hypothetical protein
MASLELAEVILAIIIGTLAAIVYSLRVLLILEKRVANMEQHIQQMAKQILKEERKIVTVKKRRPGRPRKKR